MRDCTNPEPLNGGKDCSILGGDMESRVCHPEACPGVKGKGQDRDLVYISRIQEALSVLMLCLVTVGGHFRIIPKWWTSSILMLCSLSRGKKRGINSVKCLNMASSDSQIDKPQRGHPTSRKVGKLKEGLTLTLPHPMTQSNYKKITTII